ncbi:MAG: matrixin family metalloprotease [Pseudomonadota bacterium]
MKFYCAFLLGIALASPLHAFKLIEGPKWDLADGPIGYYIDPAGSDDVSDGSDVDALKLAFRNWACVMCSSIQFRYDGEVYKPCNPGGSCPGGLFCLDLGNGTGACVPQDARIDDPSALTDRLNQVAEDGHNMLYFVETEADWPFGPGTMSASILGVCERGGGPSDSDIVFNGADHSWSSTDPMSADADITSIAAHEIGHFVGLDHPCEDENNTDTCVPSDQAIMFPVYPGGLVRAPLPDDQAGICELFGPGKEVCEGRKVTGEPCAQNCECEANLRCILGEDGGRYCAPLCAGDDSHCPRGMACMLASRRGSTGVPAQGACSKVIDINALPPSAACNRDLQCQSRSCTIVPDLGRTACVQTCLSKDQCPGGYLCVSNTCVVANPDHGVPCPETEKPEECGCGQLARPAWLGLFALLGGLALWRRRRGLGSLVLLAALLPGLAQATVVAPLDLDRMIALSDTIVNGRVLAISVEELTPQGLIVTRVLLRVDEAVVGASTGEVIEVLVPGGDLGARRQVVPGSHHFAVGEEVVLMLSRWRDHLVPVAVGVGKFSVRRTDDGQAWVHEVNTGVPAAHVDGSGHTVFGTRVTLPDVPLEDLMQELRARVAHR